jgi:phosphatidylethanolamine/phosphatidyl-N-methylethanolamine N-methyltransferase
MSQLIDTQETAKTQARYNRIAPIYDVMEIFAERRFTPWRQKLWSEVPDGQILEVGVGTGKNFPYHPAGVEVTGVDLSDRMLARARQKAEKLGYSIQLHEMDAQQLDFPDDSFDAAAATFVFCSVPDPERGLREMARVVKPGGRIVLLEHVRIDQPAIIGKVMDLLDPLVARLMGPHINRRTAETVRRAGLEVERVEDLTPRGLVKLIVARSSSNGTGR